MEKKIHIFYIEKLKQLSLKLSESISKFIDNDFDDFRPVANCQKAVYHWLDKAGITEPRLREELLYELSGDNSHLEEKLKNLGWQILEGGRETSREFNPLSP